MMKTKLEQIKEKVTQKGLFIARIPAKTKGYFIELANQEFEGDYGMLVKFLCDLNKGYFPTGHEEIEAKIDILAEEIAKIKARKEEDKPKKIKTVDGKSIRRKE